MAAARPNGILEVGAFSAAKDSGTVGFSGGSTTTGCCPGLQGEEIIRKKIDNQMILNSSPSTCCQSC